MTPLAVICAIVRQRPLAHEERIHRIVGQPRMRAEYARQVRLRVEVDAERALLALRDAGKQVQCRRRLADAAFLIEYRDDRHRRILQDALAHDGDDDFRE